MADSVLCRIEAGIAHVRLNRPDKYNALDDSMFEGLLAVGDTVRSDASVRVVLLSGEGRGFCAGLDMSNFARMAGGEIRGDSKGVSDAYEARSPSGANRAQLLAWQWQELEQPVVAAVHGAAMGAGLNIALAADMRVVAPDAKLGFVEITWGLLPDMSGTQSMRRILPADRMKELMMTGRVLSGSEALEYGLATRLSDSPLQTAREIAEQIARHNPDAVRNAKRLCSDPSLFDLAEGLRAESDASRSMLGKPNQVEAVKARLEGREPDFE